VSSFGSDRVYQEIELLRQLEELVRAFKEDRLPGLDAIYKQLRRIEEWREENK